MKLTKKDFESHNEVRWCPGCGDYAVLASIQKTLANMNAKHHEHVFISGIGCASRLPYYMKAYGFHTIHGRAPTVATGLKLARPELNVWIITGDGDGMSIGAHHLMHIMRRNINVNILLLNNRIYGLTKGQSSPTSPLGQKSKSTPTGSIEAPLDPIKCALAQDCSFVGRAIDVDAPNLQKLLEAAVKHQGTSFIEILQNCHVYNDGTFASIADRSVRDERTIQLAPNQPMIFGANKDKGLKIINNMVEVVDLHHGADADLYAINSNPLLPNIVNSLSKDNMPVAMGVLQQKQRQLSHYNSAAVSKDTLKQALHLGSFARNL